MKNEIRDMIFISHANPEDNECARWLSLRLIAEGFPVWCDLVKLKGGEDFWSDIEKAIRNRTIKFIYLLSKTSNSKDGPLKELAVAQSVAKKTGKFILPVKIDDLPHDDTNIELKRLTAIDFRDWSKGFLEVVKWLDDEGVGRKEGFSRDAVTNWWQQNFGCEDGVSQVPERYFSNWFEIESKPLVFIHYLPADITKTCKNFDLPSPVYPFGKSIISFADAKILNPILKKAGVGINRSSVHDMEKFLQGDGSVPVRDAQRVIVNLLKLQWEAEMLKRGLNYYQLSRGARCYWYKNNHFPKNEVKYLTTNGKAATRQLVGKRLNLCWHYAIQARPFLQPFLGYAIKSHIIFTIDGNEPVTSQSRQHSHRRGLGKSWWNDDWRDRLLAFMSSLSLKEKSVVQILIDNKELLLIKNTPVIFESPVSYIVKDRQVRDVVVDEDALEEKEVISEEVTQIS